MATFTAQLPIKSAEGKIGVATWDRLGELSKVGDVYVPTRIHVHLFGSDETDETPAQPGLELEIEVRQGVPVCTRIEMRAKEDGREVTPKDLLIVKGQMLYWLEKFTTFCAQATEDQDITRVPGWADRNTAQNSVRQARKASRRKITPDLLADVAKLYRVHVDGNPIEAIRRAYKVSPRTAARYVEICRSDEHGLLPKTTPGKKQA
jgi:hypothetical protein